MEIDRAMDRWFRETAEEINSTPKEDKPIYNLCASVLPLAHNYCDAVLLLLNSDKKLPAMALLRILGELTFRLVWCLFEDNPKKESVDVRIGRWRKETFEQEKKRLTKVMSGATPDEKKNIEENVTWLEREISNIPYTPAGALYNCLDELPAGYKKSLYPLLYGQFNTAVHPDLLTLSKLVRQNGNVRGFIGDFNDVDVQNLKVRCMDCAFNIISYIRIIYDLDYKNLKGEYLKIKSETRSKTEV
jgi:hypothetical protein